MTPEKFHQSQVKQHFENVKQTRTKIPEEVTRVRNAATGEVKLENEEWRNELLAVEYQLKDLASAFNLTGNLLMYEELTHLARRVSVASKNAL